MYTVIIEMPSGARSTGYPCKTLDLAKTRKGQVLKQLASIYTPTETQNMFVLVFDEETEIERVGVAK